MLAVVNKCKIIIMEKQKFLAAHMTEFKEITRQLISNEVLEEIIKMPQGSIEKPRFTAPDIEGFTFQNIEMESRIILELPKFTHCKFINGSFYSGFVVGTSFKNCLMQNFLFINVEIIHSNEFRNCVFYNCDFRGTILQASFIEHCCFIECDLRHLTIYHSYLKDTTFIKCVGLDSIAYNNTINEHVESI